MRRRLRLNTSAQGIHDAVSRRRRGDAVSDTPRGNIEARIAEYLSTGGLFNPELADHNAVRDLIIDCRKELADLRIKMAEATARYQWCANELLACDYGDNETNGKVCGWRVYGWRSRNGDRRIYGESIDAAIDAARKP
jgi:hypothetical protein